MSGVQTRLHFDNGDVHAHSVQDVEDILDANKALQNDPQKSDWGRHIASIPNIQIVKWMNEEGVNLLKLQGSELQRFLRRKLNDPDYRWLRVDGKCRS